MSLIADFIQSGHLPDIEYRTVAPEEIVSPRITTREGVPVVYMHGERSAPHKAFVPAADSLHRLARREPNRAASRQRATDPDLLQQDRARHPVAAPAGLPAQPGIGPGQQERISGCLPRELVAAIRA